MKRIAILGSTGSIGVQALDVIRLHPERFQVVSLAAGRRIDDLERQIREFSPKLVSTADASAALELRRRFPSSSLTVTTDASEAAVHPDADLVIAGLPGSLGLEPTFAAVEAGKDVALATKEVLVMAGSLFMDLVAEKGVQLLPVDSEQSAIFQCLQGHAAPVRRVLLTASGGPFRDTPTEETAGVTPEAALRHPRWKMGPKVTIDSATLMNKGLEVIEASWLFGVPGRMIETVIHPQSIIHSMVEFEDGSIMAQLGETDMRIPISYAMAFPERVDSGVAPLDFAKLAKLTFFAPDFGRFPLLKAAYDVLEEADTSACVIMNAADEVAVDMFLRGKIRFLDIARRVLSALENLPRLELRSLSDIRQFHHETTERLAGLDS